MIEKREAIRRAGSALGLFVDASPHLHERVGALIEALNLLCDDADPGRSGELRRRASEHAARLADARRRYDPARRAEVSRLRTEMRWMLTEEAIAMAKLGGVGPP